MIKVIVFDLDGTLADTADLQLNSTETSIRRTPFDILTKYPPFSDYNQLWKYENLQDDILKIIDCGVRVHVITRSPSAYASTVLFLLQVTFHELHSGTKITVEEKLTRIKTNYNLDFDEMLYIGDTIEDEISTRGICLFENIEKISPENNTYESIFQKLVSICKSSFANFELANPNNGDASYIFESRDAVNRFQNFVTDLVTEDQEKLQTKYSKYFANWSIEQGIIKPLFNPFLLTYKEFKLLSADEKIQLSEFFEKRYGAKKSRMTLKYGHAENIDLQSFPIYSYKEYMNYANYNESAQYLWKIIKDWRNEKSGPEVHLSFLDYVAEIMSAGMARCDKNSILVPIPSHNCNLSSPGQVSIRLAERIGNLTKLDVIDLISRGQINEESTTQFSLNREMSYSQKIILIDDQLTTGKTASEVFKLFRLRQFGNIELHTFSFSSGNWVRAIDFDNQEQHPCVSTKNELNQISLESHISRIGSRWSKVEDLALVKGLLRGESIDFLSKTIGRTGSSIEARKIHWIEIIYPRLQSNETKLSKSYTRYGKTWTNDELEEMVKLWNTNLSIEEICERLQRPIRGVIEKLMQLNVISFSVQSLHKIEETYQTDL